MTDDPTTTKSGLRIWQQNCNASNLAQLDMLHAIRRHHVDIVCIQEPYINPGHVATANVHWHVVYPPSHAKSPDKTRSVTFVHKALDTSFWTPIPIDCPDITAIRITSNATIVEVFSIYNDCTHDRSL
ncbi:hypothetical protein FA95DRAFT_1494721, partial [Auriscalpium vulgare]